MIQIGMIAVDRAKAQIGSIDMWIDRAGVHIQGKATETHGVTDAMLDGMNPKPKSQEEAMAAVASFIEQVAVKDAANWPQPRDDFAVAGDDAAQVDAAGVVEPEVVGAPVAIDDDSDDPPIVVASTCCITAHNGRGFDFRFLINSMRRTAVQLPTCVKYAMDPLLTARRLIANKASPTLAALPNLKLGTLHLKFAGAVIEQAHNALADTIALATVLRHSEMWPHRSMLLWHWADLTSHFCANPALVQPAPTSNPASDSNDLSFCPQITEDTATANDLAANSVVLQEHAIDAAQLDRLQRWQSRQALAASVDAEFTADAQDNAGDHVEPSSEWVPITAPLERNRAEEFTARHLKRPNAVHVCDAMSKPLGAMELFNLLFSTSIDLLIRETNRYAEEKRAALVLSNLAQHVQRVNLNPDQTLKRRYGRPWEPVDRLDFLRFLAIVIQDGVVLSTEQLWLDMPWMERMAFRRDMPLLR